MKKDPGVVLVVLFRAPGTVLREAVHFGGFLALSSDVSTTLNVLPVIGNILSND